MREELPDARSGLPKPLERRLIRPYADTFLHRVGAAAAVRALGVLVRKHPRTALELLGAALAQAGRTGLAEVKRKVAPNKAETVAGEAAEAAPDAAAQAEPSIDKRQLKVLRQALKEAEREDPGATLGQ